MTAKVKGLLIDSGKVLNYPKTGDWFITPHFFDFVDRHQFYKTSKRKRNNAFYLAGKYISKQSYILTQEEEYKHFVNFYEILFKALDHLGVTKDKIEKIARDLVFNEDKYLFYKDAIPFLERSICNYKLAVVSDAWPSLEKVFIKADARKYFESFVISSQEGVCKPDGKMYSKALEELGIEANEAIFIDDRKKNCDGAKAIGIKTVLICRDRMTYLYYKIFCKEHLVVNTLDQIDFK